MPVVLVLVGPACASPPEPSTDPDAAAPVDRTASPDRAADGDRARAFQREYERELRADERSCLTAVAARYLAPGQTLTLARVDGAWVEAEAPGIRFESTAEALIVQGEGGEQRFDARATIELGTDGRHAVVVSRQGQSWRILIHDREAERRASFPGIEWFPIDAALIVEATLEPDATREPSVLQTSRGETKTLYLVGEARFELDGRALALQVFGYGPEPVEDEPLLIPFRDQTTGHESYAAGRYLELTRASAGSLRLDFNRATNPLCAYSEHYNCPMPPRFNALPLAIRAGAKSPH